MRKLFLVFASISVAVVAVAQSAVPQWAVDKFVYDKSMKHAAVSVCVADIKTGNVLAGHNINEVIGTASTMKTITSSVALELLGKDYRFHTKVNAMGIIKNGTLEGNLVIVGGGDPTLGSQFFKDMPEFTQCVADALIAMGIKSIKGSIVADQSLFPYKPFVSWWSVDDLPWTYGVGIHALNFSDNTVSVSFDRSVAGTVKNVKTVPFVNDANIGVLTKASNANNFDAMLNYGLSPRLELLGSVKQGKKTYTTRLANPDPASSLCDSVAATLKLNGINVADKKLSAKELTETTQVIDYESPALKDIIFSLLERSDNMFTECLYRAIGLKAGYGATEEGGAKAIREYWASRGLDVDALWQYDGSGLSRTDKASTYFFTQMLKTVQSDSATIGVSFASLMNVLGKTNNIGNLVKESPLSGKIANKSGSMTQVLCYVGYYPVEDPKYTWAVLVNCYLGSTAELKRNIDTLLIDLFTEKSE